MCIWWVNTCQGVERSIWERLKRESRRGSHGSLVQSEHNALRWKAKRCVAPGVCDEERDDDDDDTLHGNMEKQQTQCITLCCSKGCVRLSV